MRTPPILTRFTQHHLRSWGCDPLYQQFWQMKKGQNAWHWALPLHILHWGKSTPQMLNQWRFRSRQAGCWRRHFILYLAWIGHDFRCHSVFLNDKKVPDKWSWWDQWELPGVLLCIEFINNSDMDASERLNCCGGSKWKLQGLKTSKKNNKNKKLNNKTTKTHTQNKKHKDNLHHIELRGPKLFS